MVGEYSTHFVCHAFDVHMIIHPPGVPIPRPQVLFSLSIAIQRALCTLQGSEVRVDIRPKKEVTVDIPCQPQAQDDGSDVFGCGRYDR